jgi:Ras-related GTP-binding protein C/D
LSDTPDLNNHLLDGQQTPVSLDNQVDPDSESLERRLLEHQDEQQQQQQQQQQQITTASSEAEASSLIKLDNGDVLYMREVNRLLVLICLLRQDNFEKHGLIDYNFQCFKEAVTEVFEFSRKRNTQQQQQE